MTFRIMKVTLSVLRTRSQKTKSSLNKKHFLRKTILNVSPWGTLKVCRCEHAVIVELEHRSRAEVLTKMLNKENDQSKIAADDVRVTASASAGTRLGSSQPAKGKPLECTVRLCSISCSDHW